MKTLIENSTKLSKFMFEDSVVINQTSATTTIGNPPELVIGDLGSSNSTVIEDLSNVPSDWHAERYTYDNGWKNAHPTDDGNTYKWVPWDTAGPGFKGWVIDE